MNCTIILCHLITDIMSCFCTRWILYHDHYYCDVIATYLVPPFPDVGHVSQVHQKRNCPSYNPFDTAKELKGKGANYQESMTCDPQICLPFPLTHLDGQLGIIKMHAFIIRHSLYPHTNLDFSEKIRIVTLCKLP